MEKLELLGTATTLLLKADGVVDGRGLPKIVALRFAVSARPSIFTL